MGILDKIEDKLGGNKHGNTTDKHGHNTEKPLYSGTERKSLEHQAGTHGQQLPGHSGIPGQTSSSGYGTSGSGLTGTGAATSGTGAGAASGLYSSGTSGQPYGSSTTGSSTTGSRAQELRHPVQTATTGTALGQPGQYSSNTMGSGYGSGSTNVDNDGYGSSSGAYKTHPVEAVDPHSTKGQNAMYHASSGGPNTGHGTSTNDYGIPGRASTDDVDRSRHGGVTNAMGSSGSNRSAGGYNLENPSAIPTAGGEKVGGVGEHEGRRDHHLGRDAAGVAGAGALGTGAYEAERKHHGHGQDSSHLTNGTNHGTSGLTSSTGGRDNYGTSGLSNTTGTGRDHHYGRDAAVGAGALGSAGAYEEHKHRDRDETGHHLGSNKHHNEYTSSGRDQLPQASSYPEMYNSGDSRNDQYGSSNTGLGSGNRDHHYGRDAALAGTGALGAGEYERKHHDRDNVRDDKYDNTSSSSGGMGSTIKNKLGMGSSNNNTTNTSSRDNEYGTSHGTSHGTSQHHHHDEEKDIEERLEEIRLNRRLKEIRAGRQV